MPIRLSSVGVCVVVLGLEPVSYVVTSTHKAFPGSASRLGGRISVFLQPSYVMALMPDTLAAISYYFLNRMGMLEKQVLQC